VTEHESAAAQLPLDHASEVLEWPVSEIAALIEALLLVAPEAPRIDDLAGAIGIPRAKLEAGLLHLDEAAERGWIVQRHGELLYLASAPRFSAQVRSFLGADREGKLSPAALETLAIIAYHQPITRGEIEAIRGVDSSGVIATLHSRELVEPVARLAAVGNPFQYGTTVGFLKLFGLSSLADLPPIGQVEGEDGAALLTAAIESARASEDVQESPTDENADDASTVDNQEETGDA
jgi:segregation and condensation protein B